LERLNGLGFRDRVGTKTPVFTMPILKKVQWQKVRSSYPADFFQASALLKMPTSVSAEAINSPGQILSRERMIPR
jgi:hypothetical protein